MQNLLQGSLRRKALYHKDSKVVAALAPVRSQAHTIGAQQTSSDFMHYFKS